MATTNFVEFIKSFIGKIIIGVLVALTVASIIGYYQYYSAYDIEGVWKIKMDYETFFSTHISKFKKCQILGNGEIFIVQNQNNYKGLAFLEIALTPESFSQEKDIITLVLEFNNFTISEKNKYNGLVEVKFRAVDMASISKYVLPYLTDKKSLSVPTSYSFTLNANNDNDCSGLFLGVLKDGATTTKGGLSLIR